MRPAGELGDYTAILFVYGLTGDDIGQDHPVAADGATGLVAGRFDSEDGDGCGSRGRAWSDVWHGAKLRKSHGKKGGRKGAMT